MRMQFEHGDVIKALAFFMKSKGYSVEPDPANFVFTNESNEPGKIELLVLVKNMDIAPIEAPPPPPPSLNLQGTSTGRLPAGLGSVNRSNTPKPAAPTPRRPAPPAPKNSMFLPVAPPQLIPPPPKHRVLDKQAASSPALMLAGRHPHMPLASAVVPAFEGSEKGAEELVDTAPLPRAAVAPEGSLLINPEDMSSEDRDVFNEILLRSAARAEEGPHYATDAADDGSDVPTAEGHLED